MLRPRADDSVPVAQHLCLRWRAEHGPTGSWSTCSPASSGGSRRRRALSNRPALSALLMTAPPHL